jgi:hypothetical protein
VGSFIYPALQPLNHFADKARKDYALSGSKDRKSDRE